MKREGLYRWTLRSLACLLGSLLSLFGVIYLAVYGCMRLSGAVQNAPLGLFGLAFLAAGALCFAVQGMRDRWEADLRETGVACVGRVVQVRTHRGIQLRTGTFQGSRGALHPQTVVFECELDGTRCRGKSAWYWYMPPYAPGDPIDVWADPRQGRRCVCAPPEPRIDGFSKE